MKRKMLKQGPFMYTKSNYILKPKHLTCPVYSVSGLLIRCIKKNLAKREQVMRSGRVAETNLPITAFYFDVSLYCHQIYFKILPFTFTDKSKPGERFTDNKAVCGSKL